jgi:hypothetical protein
MSSIVKGCGISLDGVRCQFGNNLSLGKKIKDDDRDEKCVG